MGLLGLLSRSFGLSSQRLLGAGIVGGQALAYVAAAAKAKAGSWLVPGMWGVFSTETESGPCEGVFCAAPLTHPVTPTTPGVRVCVCCCVHAVARGPRDPHRHDISISMRHPT